jgi:hypothetical protein
MVVKAKGGDSVNIFVAFDSILVALQKPCVPASALLKSTQMRPLAQLKLSSLKTALAALLASLVFVLGLATSSNWLHSHLHSEADHGQSPCAVCTVSKGQLDAPVVAVSEVFASPSVSWTLLSIQTLAPAAIDLSIAPSRGPPASVSSQS